MTVRSSVRLIAAGASCLILEACILFVAAPFTIQNEFSEKRAALKDQVEKGLTPAAAGEAECLRMLDQVGRGMTAPPPISPEVCKFGSFADKRYELTLLVQKRTLTPEAWARECQALANKPVEGDPCKYDPIGEQLVEWKRLIADGRTSKEGAEHDCKKVVEAAASAGKQRTGSADDICQF